MKTIKVAIVGGGWYTWIHVDGLTQFNGMSTPVKVEVTGAVLGRSDPLGEAEKRGIKGFESAAKMAEAIRAGIIEVDYVLNVTPDHKHEETTIPFLEAEVDVYLEKPIAHTNTSALTIARKAKEHGRFVGQNYTYTKTWAAAAASEICLSGMLSSEEPDEFDQAYQQGYERGCPTREDNETGPLSHRRNEGDSNVEGDLWPHLASLGYYIHPSLRVTQVSSARSIVLRDKRLPDRTSANVWAGDVPGTINVSQVRHGGGNPPTVYVGFPSAGLEFTCGEPAGDTLVIKPTGKAWRTLRFGADMSDEEWLDGIGDKILQRLGNPGANKELTEEFPVGVYPDQHGAGLPRWLMSGHWAFWTAREQIAAGKANFDDPFVNGCGTVFFGAHAQQVIQASIDSAANSGIVTEVGTDLTF